MPTRAITQPPESRPGGDWRGQTETAPSMMRSDDPTIARFVGLAAGALVVFGGLALVLQALGRVTPMPIGLSTFLLTAGIAGLLFHAAFDWDVQFRRIYMVFGYVALIVGAFLAVVPYNGKAGALFGQGFLCLFLGLLFLLAFLRNETDEWMRKVAETVIGALGAIMALIGIVGGNIKGEFFTPIGLLLAVLGIVYLTAYVGSRGISDDRVYRVGQAIGIAGVLVALVALGRSILPPLFHSWHWKETVPDPYFIPYGALLLVVGVVYGCAGLFLCSDNRLIVLTRRELGSMFYSPIAYVLLAVFVVAHWLAYMWPVWRLLSRDEPMPEPIVAHFILQLTAVISTIVAVPVLTMRLLSEEKRSGTLEVLLTAPVDEGVIVISKFLAAYVMYLVMWLPFGLFLAYFRVGGGSEFDYRPLFSFAIGQLATGAAFIGMGVFFSSLTRNQVASGILAFGGMLALTVVYFFGGLASQIMANSTEPLRGQMETLSRVLKHVSYIDLWIDTLDGRLFLRQVLFFVSLAVVWLFVSVKVVEARKWT
ncbi:MAG TPA: ABC transporter permease [Gemmataceae bacterium]|nr:ABC transporter permease [Gemmataceae bacterium]